LLVPLLLRRVAGRLEASFFRRPKLDTYRVEELPLSWPVVLTNTGDSPIAIVAQILTHRCGTKLNRMRFIPRRLHGLADYIVGFVVIGLPLLYGWTGSQRTTVIVLGSFVLVYSICTDYEFGAISLFSFRSHLFFDLLFGFLMLAAPWLLNFSQDSFSPLALIGLLAIFFVATTEVPCKTTEL
jgi:hypothetical protein